MKPVAKVSVLADPDVDPWPVLWQSFERSMRADNASPRTLDIYRDGADLFYAFQRERGWPTDPARIEKRHVEDFLIWLRDERRAKPATVRARFSTLRRFFNWCIEEGEIEASPMQRMHGPRVEEPPPPVLSEGEQRALLAACMGNGFDDRRDAALLRLMLDTGLRRGEAAAVKLGDLDLDGQAVTILGKGNRPGVAFFGVKTARDLDRYLRMRARHPHAGLPVLWLAQRGPLTGDAIHHLIARRARMAGIERTVHPHMTRHSWADGMKRAGASEEDIMVLGRWKNRQVMARYGQSAALSRARETARRLSPGDRL
jgi:site-specific recombinase XerD